jgi:hypothetical protein
MVLQLMQFARTGLFSTNASARSMQRGALVVALPAIRGQGIALGRRAQRADWFVQPGSQKVPEDGEPANAACLNTYANSTPRPAKKAQAGRGICLAVRRKDNMYGWAATSPRPCQCESGACHPSGATATLRKYESQK